MKTLSHTDTGQLKDLAQSIARYHSISEGVTDKQFRAVKRQWARAEEIVTGIRDMEGVSHRTSQIVWGLATPGADIGFVVKG